MGKISASQLLAPASLLVQCLKSSFLKNSSKVTVVSDRIWNRSERVPERETERKKKRKKGRATSSLSLPAQQWVPDWSSFHYRVSPQPSHREWRKKSCIVPKLGTKINRVWVEGVLPPKCLFFLGFVTSKISSPSSPWASLACKAAWNTFLQCKYEITQNNSVLNMVMLLYAQWEIVNKEGGGGYGCLCVCVRACVRMSV